MPVGTTNGVPSATGTSTTDDPPTGKSPITTPCAQPVPSTSIDGWTRRHRPTASISPHRAMFTSPPAQMLRDEPVETVVQPDTTGLEASQEHIMFSRPARPHPAQQAGLRSGHGSDEGVAPSG